MNELSTELGRFIGGAINLDQLRAFFRTYIAKHQDQRELVSHWLRNTVEEGRLSATVWLSLRDLFEAPAAASFAMQTRAAAGASPASSQQVGTQLAAPNDSAQATELARVPPPSAHPSDPRSDSLRIGMVVRERFVLVEQLGSGGMGQVFKARDLRREEAQDRHPFIALKVLNKEVSAHPASFMALQREARRASMLAHPNVVTVYDFDRDGERIYMTMEYLEGRGLDTFIHEECDSGLPLVKVWPIIRGIAMALDYGHQKRVVHSDLKPGNIFICKDGTVKVLDFGIARLVHSTDTKTEETLFDPMLQLRGLTPAYASLEMWNRESPDARDDIYALACVTYELLSGRHPFDRKSAKVAVDRRLSPQRIEGITRAQWESLRKGLALRREQRSPSVGSFIKPFMPQSRVRRYALPGAVAAVLVTAAALAVSARYYRVAVEDSTMQILQCAQIPRPAAAVSDQAPVPPTAEQRQQIDDYITLARDYMRDATPTISIEDLKYILTDGPNSVSDILDTVLTIEPTHAEALALRANVADMYSTRAQLLLDQRRVPEALDLVRYGRKVLPASQDLFHLEQTICKADAAAQRR